MHRADRQRDYARIDALADALAGFAPSEICELARSQDVVVRALANEALAQFPTSTLIGLLSDPVDSEIARDALRRQAMDYGSEEARQIVNALAQVDAANDDFCNRQDAKSASGASTYSLRLKASFGFRLFPWRYYLSSTVVILAVSNRIKYEAFTRSDVL